MVAGHQGRRHQGRVTRPFRYRGLTCGTEPGLEALVDNFLQLENRHNREILRMRRVRDTGGQAVLTTDGSLTRGFGGEQRHEHASRK